MRYALVVFLVASPLFAQAPPPRREVPVRYINEIMALDRLASRLQESAAVVKRDAYIVSEVVKGSGELNDFQKSVAIQKALDRVNAAIMRADTDPQASPQTKTALSQIKDALVHGHDQGTMADLPSLQKLMIDKTHTIYYDLFRELDQTRRERQAIVDLQTKLAVIANDLDSAMTDALGSSFDFIRAGGK